METPSEGQSSGSHLDPDPETDPETNSGAAYYGDDADYIDVEQYREGPRRLGLAAAEQVYVSQGAKCRTEGNKGQVTTILLTYCIILWVVKS